MRAGPGVSAIASGRSGAMIWQTPFCGVDAGTAELGHADVLAQRLAHDLRAG